MNDQQTIEVDPVLEDRLRRTLRAVAELDQPSDGQGLVAGLQPRVARPRRRAALLVAAAVVVLAAVGGAAAVTQARGPAPSTVAEQPGGAAARPGPAAGEPPGTGPQLPDAPGPSTDTAASLALADKARALLPGFTVSTTSEIRWGDGTSSVFAQLDRDDGMHARLAILNVVMPNTTWGLLDGGVGAVVSAPTPGGTQISLTLRPAPHTVAAKVRPPTRQFGTAEEIMTRLTAIAGELGR